MKIFLPLTIFAFFVFTTITYAQSKLTNISAGESDKSSNPSDFILFNDLMFFEASTANDGREIWVSDGTTGNTRLLKDINPGSRNGIITAFKETHAVLGDKLFFIANDGEYGNQLWSTNGTNQGTQRVTKLSNMNVQKLTVAGDWIFFLVRERDKLQVWKSNGTAEGTLMVKGDLPIMNSPSFEGAVNNVYLFTFQPYGSNNSRLWRSDGTEAGTFPLTEEMDGNGAGSTGTSQFTQYIVFNNALYFVVRKASLFSFTNTVGIMKTDGTLANTLPLKGLFDGSTGLIDFADVITVNEKLYFSFYQFRHSHLFIWESDGTGTGTSKIYDHTSSEYFAPSNLSTDGNQLVFTGAGAGGKTALLKMELATYEVKEVKVLPNSSIKPPFFSSVFMNEIAKIADNSFLIHENFQQFQTWHTDLTEANTVVRNEFKLKNEFFNHKGSIYFSGNATPVGSELMKTNFSLQAPSLVRNIDESQRGLDGTDVVLLNNKLIFYGWDNEYGLELLAYDILKDEVGILKDTRPGVNTSVASELIRFKNHLYFSVYVPGSKIALWRSDGTAAGTEFVSNNLEFPDASKPRRLVANNKYLFFFTIENDNLTLNATDGGDVQVMTTLVNNPPGLLNKHSKAIAVGDLIYFTLTGEGEDLWRSDGTKSGTFKVKDFSSIYQLTAVGDKLYFSAEEVFNKEPELWITDGTESGTKQVKDFANNYSANPHNFTSYNNELIFTAYTQEHGSELWKSDGTAAGTVLLADINPGAAGSMGITSYAILDDQLYFTANDGTHGVELWKTNGTTAGTSLVKDINAGEKGSLPTQLISNGSLIYFSAYTNENGVELWTSDGSGTGTKLLFDLNSGQAGSSPTNLLFLDEELFFIAEKDVSEGRQLWRYKAEVGPTGLDGGNFAQPVVLYPNPTFDYLYIDIRGQNFQSIQVFNLSGQHIPLEQVAPNKLYVGSLLPGMYILIAESENTRVVKKFIRK